MKKTLLTLGVLAAMTFGFAACGGNPDCNCTVTMGDENIPLYTDDNPTFTDYDGECDDIVNGENLPEAWKTWANIVELGGSIKCVED